MKLFLALAFLISGTNAISAADYIAADDIFPYVDDGVATEVMCCYDASLDLNYNRRANPAESEIEWPTTRRLAGFEDFKFHRRMQGLLGEQLDVSALQACDYCCNLAIEPSTSTGLWPADQPRNCENVPDRNYLNCAGNRAIRGCGGEPHFKTWADKWYDYHGECDLILLSVPDFDNNLGLDVHIRTKIRYDYSYISSAALKIGDDVLEVSSFGDYMINGVANAEMPGVLATMYPITYTMISDKQHLFNIQLNEYMSINIKTFKDFVSVNFQGNDVKIFQNSVGMLGNRITGELLARDGKTVIEDPNEFGQEWQVRNNEAKLFNHVDRYPQHPQQCILPDPNAKQERRRLGEGISREAAEKACAHWSDDDREHCVFDVMATGDLEMAEANGAF